MPALELDYTNRDYDSILTFLTATAKGFMPEWVTAGEPGDFGSLLLELYAYASDIQNYYIDRVAAEPFLASAQRRLSVLSIADMLGYRPIAQTAASGVVTFTIQDGYYTEDLVIPAGTQVRTTALRDEDAIYFETAATVTFTPGGDLTADVGVNEGRTVTDEFVATSNGAPVQSYVLINSGVIQRALTLTVQESDDVTAPWSFVDRISDAGPDASAYTTFVDEQNFMHILFGDNSAGRIPPVGSRIFVTYRYGAGAAGNVQPSTIVEFVTPISGLTVNNSAPTTGGADNESIDSMRYSIPRASRIRDRAVTLQDFADLAQQVPGVAKAAADGLIYTQVTVRVAPVGGGAPDASLIERVDTYLTARCLIGASVVVLGPVYMPFECTAVVHVLAQYGRETVRQQVFDALKGLFAFEAVGFNDVISIGEVYRTAMAVTGVDYITLNLFRPLTGFTADVQDIVTGPDQIPQMDPALYLTITADGGIV